MKTLNEDKEDIKNQIIKQIWNDNRLWRNDILDIGKELVRKAQED